MDRRAPHDRWNYRTCECGQRGCGSYRPIPGGPTAREMRAETELPEPNPFLSALLPDDPE